MMKSTRIVIAALAWGLLSAGLYGCQKTESAAENEPAGKGTAEQVGEHLDQAAAEAAKHLNKIAEGAGKGLEKAGESLQKGAKEAQENAAQEKNVPATDSQANEIQK